MVTPLDVIKDALDDIQAAQVAVRADLKRAEHTQTSLLGRLSRMETRLCRLMDVHGLDEQGQPKPDLTVSPGA